MQECEPVASGGSTKRGLKGKADRCERADSPANDSWERLPAASPMCSNREVIGRRGLSIQLGTKPKKGRTHVTPARLSTPWYWGRRSR